MEKIDKLWNFGLNAVQARRAGASMSRTFPWICRTKHGAHVVLTGGEEARSIVVREDGWVSWWVRW